MSTYKRKPQLQQPKVLLNPQRDYMGRLIINPDGTSKWIIESTQYNPGDRAMAYTDLLRVMNILTGDQIKEIDIL